MSDLLGQYINKMLEFEEKGYLDEALELSNKMLDTFVEDKVEILLERGKFQFRNANYQEALTDFIYAYQISNDSEIYELVLEAYLYPNQENLILQYKENLKLLENYPHYKNEYPQEEELHFYPIFQNDEMVACVDTQSRTFAIDYKQEIENYPEHGNCYMMFNKLWSEDILKCEEMSRILKPFMDMNRPMYLVYDKLYWLLFLQLQDVTAFIESKRIVFLVGEKAFREYLSDTQVIMPNRVQDEKYANYIQALSEVAVIKYQYYNQGLEKIHQYYSGNKEMIDEHIKSGKPKILFMTSRFTAVLQYHMRDCMEAAKTLGCETELVIEPDGIRRVTDFYTVERLAEFKPDIIFCIDHFRYEKKFAIPQEIVWITWIQDKLSQSTGNPKIQGMLKKRDIVISPFVSDLPGKHWNMNYKDVLKAPLSANQDIYKKRELLQEEKELYSCDICYVANASNYRKRVEEYKQGIPLEMQEDFQLVMDVYFQLMKEEIFYYGYERNKEVLSLILDQLKINWPEQFVSQLAEDMVLSIGYSRYKSLIVEWLLEAGYTNIKLYGNEWGEDEKFGPYAMGVIENGEKLSKALNASKVVLAMHPVFSLAARTIEAVSSGAFCLVNDIPEADMANAREYFEEGKELIYFYGKQDLLEKLGYYLEHKEERERVVEAGLKKVSEVLTYERMMERVIRETSELLEKRSKEELI